MGDKARPRRKGQSSEAAVFVACLLRWVSQLFGTFRTWWGVRLESVIRSTAEIDYPFLTNHLDRKIKTDRASLTPTA